VCLHQSVIRPESRPLTLAESAVNSLVSKRMVKKQQMRWSRHGAHMLIQVRTAEVYGELRDRLSEVSNGGNHAWKMDCRPRSA